MLPHRLSILIFYASPDFTDVIIITFGREIGAANLIQN
jgi:hypothetical protein